jgi:hypothetical protein
VPLVVARGPVPADLRERVARAHAVAVADRLRRQAAPQAQGAPLLREGSRADGPGGEAE